MPAGNPFTTGSAPTPNLAMQMVAPDLTADQLQLMRQQQIADILRQQALAPMGDTQVINGWAVKKSPLEGFSRLVAALAAGASQTGIDDRQRALNTALAQRMMGALNGSPTAAASSSPASSALSEGAAQGDIGPTTTNVARIPQQPVQPSPATTDNRFGFANVLRSSLLRDLGGDPAASAFWADTAPTDTAKLLRERNAATDPFARAAYDEKLTPPIIGRGSPVLMRGPDGSLRIDPASVQAITMAEQAKAPFSPRSRFLRKAVESFICRRQSFPLSCRMARSRLAMVSRAGSYRPRRGSHPGGKRRKPERSIAEGSRGPRPAHAWDCCRPRY
jgi:hypothetical protein